MIKSSLEPRSPARVEKRWRRHGFTLVSFLLLFSANLTAEELSLNGRVVDPQNNPFPMATVQLLQGGQVLKLATSGADGRFQLKIESPGDYILKVVANGFRPVTQRVTIRVGANVPIEIRMGELSLHEEKITVTAGVKEVDILSPDPAERVYITEDMLDANPGRPGAPVSIPGLSHRNRLKRDKGSAVLCAGSCWRSWRADCTIYRCWELPRAQQFIRERSRQWIR